MPGTERTEPDEATRAVDTVDAAANAQPGRAPTPDEERLADEGAASAADVGDDYEAALERGANVKGEGAIEP